MKILVIGGTGRIGSKVVQRLRDQGHDVVAAAPSTGIDTLTGEGLEAAMAGASIVIDLANSPAFDEKTAMEFFQTSGSNVLAAAAKAGVAHHVALSVVGTEKLAGSGYFRGKSVQERLIRESRVPYTIIHSTQFFDFLPGIIASGVEGNTVRLPAALVQPIAADDVADAVARIALQPPANGIVEIAGPERAPLSELAQRFMQRVDDGRDVIGDMHAPYFGVELERDTLVPVGEAWQGPHGFDAWFAQSEYARDRTARP
jgi:uncharacterized protein YbjT (DUF2867 family)